MIENLSVSQDESYINSDIVFIGLPQYVSDDGIYQFKVIEIFKGKISDLTIEGEVRSSCSVVPSMDDGMWLVYAKIKNGKIDIDKCGLSRTFSFPIVHSTQTPPPPPINIHSRDQVIQEILYQEQFLKYRMKALALLTTEIEQLRARNIR